MDARQPVARLAMRSCDSLIKISGGPSVASRSGTSSSRTSMPPEWGSTYDGWLRDSILVTA